MFVNFNVFISVIVSIVHCISVRNARVERVSIKHVRQTARSSSCTAFIENMHCELWHHHIMFSYTKCLTFSLSSCFPDRAINFFFSNVAGRFVKECFFLTRVLKELVK